NEVKKFILDDLQKASTIRQVGWADGSNYVNAAMIEAIRVKLYAMTGDWDKVLEHGEVIMTRYRLATATEYKKLFARVTTTQGNFQEVYAEPPASAELIFKLNVTLN